jgi:hypothetical protein
VSGGGAGVRVVGRHAMLPCNGWMLQLRGSVEFPGEFGCLHRAGRGSKRCCRF